MQPCLQPTLTLAVPCVQRAERASRLNGTRTLFRRTQTIQPVATCQARARWIRAASFTPTIRTPQVEQISTPKRKRQNTLPHLPAPRSALATVDSATSRSRSPTA